MAKVVSYKKIQRSTLYEIVFNTLYVKVSVFFMFAFLLIQPVAPAFAALNEGESQDTAPASVETQVPEQETPEVETVTHTQEIETTDEASNEGEPVEEVVSEDSDVVEDVADTQTHSGDGDGETEPVLEVAIPDENDEVSGGNETPDANVDTSTTTPNTDAGTSTPSESTDGETDIEDPGSTDDQEETETPVPEIPVDESSSSDEESTDETDVQESVATTSTVVYAEQFSDLNKYQFGAQECVSVGDGAYYCSKTNDTLRTQNDESLFSELDSEGDSEIYMRIKGDTLQITDNSYDDKAPFYDPISNSVVWHQLREGRYDVFQYSLDDKEERRITDNTVNDTEPSVSGEYIVWQRWVDTNWEVMLYDGEKEAQLTFNQTHDVKPRIKGGYVIWHATGQNGETHIGVYEIATGLLSTIEDTENGSVENPRFVLVYDTTFENGDVITKGYDFESKSVVPLHSAPGSLPQELPNPDATGETRALIQNKSPQSKDSVVEEQGQATGTGTASSTPSVTASSTSPTTGEETPTLDLSASSTEPLPLTDFDIVVIPYATSSSAQASDSGTSTNFVE